MKKYLVVIKQESVLYPSKTFYRSAETKEEAEDIIRMWEYPIIEAKIYKEVEA